MTAQIIAVSSLTCLFISSCPLEFELSLWKEKIHSQTPCLSCERDHDNRDFSDFFTVVRLNMITSTDSLGVLDLWTGLAEHGRVIGKKYFRGLGKERITTSTSERKTSKPTLKTK